jgi:hypothetical protein
MDGIHEMTGAPLAVTVDDATWQLSPLTANDWGAISLEIIKGRKTPTQALEAVISKLKDDGDRKALLELAYRDELRGEMVSMQDVMDWVRTKVGDNFSTYLMARHNHPNITPDQAVFLANAKWEQLGARAHYLHGYPLGNLPTPAPVGANNAQQSPGATSSAV